MYIEICVDILETLWNYNYGMDHNSFTVVDSEVLVFIDYASQLPRKSVFSEMIFITRSSSRHRKKIMWYHLINAIFVA